MSGHIFGASASPSCVTKYLAMPPSSTRVHGGQLDDTKYMCDIRLTNACMRYSLLTKFGVIRFIQLVRKYRRSCLKLRR